MNTSSLYNLDNLIAFRRDLHKHPEIGYEEYRTSAKVIDFLHSLGISDKCIRRVAKTGIIVDINGTAPPSGKPYCVALRADMDALPIKENNKDIDYQSINNAAHLCGHDMHMTCLLGGASLLVEKLDQIPSDKTLRLLFQPCEELIGGAFCMIQEGALIGVDEVYGFHCRPWAKPGKFYVKSGYVMAQVTSIDITIHGKGGHSSLVDELIDPLQPAIDIHIQLRDLIKRHQDQNEKFVLCIPLIQTGDAFNAISDTCVLKGVLRTFSDDVAVKIKEEIQTLVSSTCKKYNCVPDIKLITTAPAVYNWEKETEHVQRVAKKVFKEENVSEGALPLYGGEDFSYFTRVKPGAFFYMSCWSKDGDMLHTSNFNANDEMIPLACEMWFRLIEDRFEVNFK